MKKLHKIAMGVLLGGLSVMPSRGYGGPVSAMTVSNSQYRDVSSTQIQNIQMVNAKPTATPEAKPNSKPTATPAMKISVKPSPTPEAKPGSKPTATPEPKPSGKVTATPEPKPNSKITVTPEPKSSPKATPTPSPKVNVVAEVKTTVKSFVAQITAFFNGWFK